MSKVTREAQCQIESAETKETAQGAGCPYLLLAEVNAFHFLILRSA
ncbi:hypothetical protein [Candidatus Symbiopectobacterium sp. NZEC135]|nr:hypothetical protein [Candidatus Symbiopectobacterium sp. NZEC135]MCW2478364.1 hypothetical protein [Candidatus Symbiopectobacterium sp. NZEC135]